MRSGSVAWTVGPIAVLAATLVGLSSCGTAQAPPARSGYPTLTVAPTAPSTPASAAVSPPITGRSPATTTIAG